jgi:hypothetical protein
MSLSFFTDDYFFSPKGIPLHLSIAVACSMLSYVTGSCNDTAGLVDYLNRDFIQNTKRPESMSKNIKSATSKRKRNVSTDDSTSEDDSKESSSSDEEDITLFMLKKKKSNVYKQNKKM